MTAKFGIFKYLLKKYVIYVILGTWHTLNTHTLTVILLLIIILLLQLQHHYIFFNQVIQVCLFEAICCYHCHHNYFFIIMLSFSLICSTRTTTLLAPCILPLINLLVLKQSEVLTKNAQKWLSPPQNMLLI